MRGRVLICDLFIIYACCPRYACCFCLSFYARLTIGLKRLCQLNNHGDWEYLCHHGHSHHRVGVASRCRTTSLASFSWSSKSHIMDGTSNFLQLQCFIKHASLGKTNADPSWTKLGVPSLALTSHLRVPSWAPGNTNATSTRVGTGPLTMSARGPPPASKVVFPLPCPVARGSAPSRRAS